MTETTNKKFKKGDKAFFIDRFVNAVHACTVERVVFDAFRQETVYNIHDDTTFGNLNVMEDMLFWLEEDAKTAMYQDDHDQLMAFKAEIKDLEALAKFPLCHVLCGEDADDIARLAYKLRAEELGVMKENNKKTEDKNMANQFNAKYFAERLDGREYGDEISYAEEKLAKENGIVIVFGYSDDNIEFRGSIDDELGCFNGGDFYVSKSGDVSGENKTGRLIRAVWCGPSGASWEYETDIPHETFNIYEDGEFFCRGIVFEMQDI